MKKRIKQKKGINYYNNYPDEQINSIKEYDDPQEDNKNEISQCLNIDKEIFEVVFKKDKDKIFISCIPKEECICLYDYSIEITYEEFCKLGKTFKLCENIDEIFKIIKNIAEEVSFSKKGIDMQSNLRIEYSEDNTIILLFKIPLLIGKYEEIKIEFKKTQKDVSEQFKKLKEKYLKIKSMIVLGDMLSLKNEFKSEIENQKLQSQRMINHYPY